MSGFAKVLRIAVVGLTVVLIGVAAGAAEQGTQQKDASTQKQPQQDIIKTETGDLTITFIGHGALMFGYRDKTVHVDPVSREGDYTKLPKADLVLITHEHGDHLDPKALNMVRKDQTKVLLTKECVEKIPDGTVMKNGDAVTACGFKIEAVPAYNIAHKRPDGQPFHPKGTGNGYVLNFDKTRVYVAGDTENIPEMAQLKKIDIAFLPMNLPYTMTPEMVAEAARVFEPKILYPYHYGQTDPNTLVSLLKDSKKTEVRVREMQ
ncbi:MAG: MBL fold metallo-hydrolase [Phycisphaerales bacterium]